MTYSIGENQSCEAKGSIRQSQPLVRQDDKVHAASVPSNLSDKPGLHPGLGYKTFIILN